MFIPDEEKRNKTTRFVLELMFAKEAKTRLRGQKKVSPVRLQTSLGRKIWRLDWDKMEH